MKSVLVDSSGFFAYLAGADPFHERAVALFQRAKAERWRLFTTNAVVFETYALLLYRTRNGRINALAFLDNIERGFCNIERLSAQDETRAGVILRAHEDKSYLLCDAASFAVMERLSIQEAIAFDRHFQEYGRFIIL
ncbi:MAG: type II toxin-antitoxin system VapC family toxin [Deltaproteobacteria bacterium]|nr:type II toxin-antitoxin system VapC family toxin [Deltaproteobacteria bacterium]